MIELLILGILLKEEFYGYQLKQFADKLLAGFFEVSYGSLYPKFKKLELDQYIKSRTTFSKGGQEKTCYQITDKGKMYFYETLKEIPNESFSQSWLRFKIKVLFFDNVDKDLQINLIENIKDLVKNEIDKIENLLETENISKYQELIIKKNLNELQTNFNWLNSL